MQNERDEEKQDVGGHEEEKDHPGSVDGPGSVTVDEPTDPALTGTAEDDFGAGKDDAGGS